MPTTNFVSGTKITKEWLNDVDAGVYEVLPTKAASGDNTDITSITGNAATATTAVSCSGNAVTASNAYENYFFTAGNGVGAENNIGALCTGQQPAYLFNKESAWGLYSVDGELLCSYTRATGKKSFFGDCSGNAATATKLSTASGSAPSYSCRAWVRFNGETNTINGSGNVSSITDNGVGDYTVNFSVSMDDDRYAFSIARSRVNGTSSSGAINQYEDGTLTNSAIRIHLENSNSGVNEDSPRISVAIFR